MGLFGSKDGKETRGPRGQKIERRRRRPVVNRRQVGAGKAETEKTPDGAERRGQFRSVLMGFAKMAVIAGVTALLAVLVVNGYNAVQASGEFTLKTIAVTGTIRLLDEEVISASGLENGEGIFEIPLVEVRERVESLPRVREASVTRRLPSTITIAVQERRPVALLQWGGPMMLADENGVYFPVMTDREQWDLPIITGLTRDETPPGGKIEQPALQNALAVLSYLDPATLAVTSEIHVDEEGGATLFTTGRHTRILFGRGDLAAKAARLAQARSLFAARGEIKEVIDLRYDDLVTRP